ncbi:SRPBCC family protein [Nocardioides caldifontis]|uniref:SRPBCC family protein n=1 Tax=Nocardioides caldifontis TaxID=2588938 RepID=UPI0011E046BC|nr:SRPBCC family protein [Nocardioides caldifontis]
MARFSVRVAAPVPEVYEYLADPRHRPEWQSSLRSVDLLTDGPPRVGTAWIDRTTAGVNPRMEIIGLVPPGSGSSEPVTWSEAGEWRGIRAMLTLTFEPAAEDPQETCVWVVVDIISGPVWLLPVRSVLRLLAPTAVRSDLRRAARIIESR